MFDLTAVNHCMPRIETNVAFGCVSLNVSVWPFAVMPEMCWDLPARNEAPPTTTSWRFRLTPSGEPIFGLRIRSHARWNDAAVTGEPSENLRPERILNV